jgi:hypothetical protein
MTAFKTGDKVMLRYRDQAVLAEVKLASANGCSLWIERDDGALSRRRREQLVPARIFLRPFVDKVCWSYCNCKFLRNRPLPPVARNRPRLDNQRRAPDSLPGRPDEQVIASFKRAFQPCSA